MAKAMDTLSVSNQTGEALGEADSFSERGLEEESPNRYSLTSEDVVKNPQQEGKPVQASRLKNRLEDQMNHEDLELLERIFQEADEDGGGGLDLDEFREAMKRIIANKGGILPDEEELGIIFMKVDANCDGTVDWEEFCSYMLMENQMKDVMSSELGADAPFPSPLRELQSTHRDTLVKLAYFPKVSYGPEDVGDGSSGRYVALSREGIMTFWTMELNLQRTVQLNENNPSNPKANKPTWVTDCVVLANLKKIAVSTTDRDVAFYDCAANNFEKHFVVSGFRHSVLCMDYWYNPENHNECMLFFGDMAGRVSVLVFSSATTGLFDVHLAKNQSVANAPYCRIMFRELRRGFHPNVRALQFALHDDWVKKVKYYPSLQCFISCATTSERSLYVGDTEGKRMSSYIEIRKGVLCFDYCSTWNVIVTGGIDHYVRLWNPYLTTKPTSTLKGHCSAVIHITVNTQSGQFISVSQDKVLKVWDIRDVCCIQTIPPRLLTPGPMIISSIYFNDKNHTLLLGTNVLFALERKGVDNCSDEEGSSHTKPLCKALYNTLFHQVVSACHDSVVIVWSLDTGEKMIQFSNAHDGVEITAMCFDQSLRRLVTGGRNGTVKMWNFNNGNCLRTLQPVDDEEITGIVCTKQRIVTVGWSKKVAIYKDSKQDEKECEPRVWVNFHKEDILSIDIYGNGCLATSSYDGDIKVWSLETAQVTCVLNANEFNHKHRPSLIPMDLKKRVSINNVIFSDLKKLEAEEKAFLQNPRFNQPSGRYSRKQNLARRRSSVDPRRQSVIRRKSMDPFCVRIHVKETDYDSGVDCVLFLQNRKRNKDTATLLSTGSGGFVHAWSLIGGGLVGEFMASNSERESILCMTTDEKNETLLTGDTQGYIKVWNIKNYCVAEEEDDTSGDMLDREDSQDKPTRRVQFAQCESRPTVRTKPPPLVLCLRAHSTHVVSVCYVKKGKLMITASTDCSLRLWRCHGQYIGTFGQRQPWSLERVDNVQLPYDLRRVASANSIKLMQAVLTRKRWSMAKTFAHVSGRLGLVKQQLVTKEGEGQKGGDERRSMSLVHDALCNIDFDNVLGKYYRAKTRHHMPPLLPKLRMNQNQIVVYSSLKCNELEPIVEPNPPAVLTQAAGNKFSPRVPSSQSEKELGDGKPGGVWLPSVSPRWRAGQTADGGKTRDRSSYSSKKGT